MKLTTKSIAFLTAAGFLVLTSCEKYQANRDTTTAVDDNITEMAFNDVFKVTDEAARTDDEENKSALKATYTFGNCATITVTPAWPDPTFPKTMVIDFGSTNCTGNDFRERRGKLNVTLSDRYRAAGSVITVVPDNYYVNDYKVEGTKTVTNNGRNGDGYLNFTVSVTGGQVTSPDGEVATREAARTREWIEGEGTILNPWDDVYRITGGSSGVNRNGRGYTVTITEALIKEVGCRWITQGKLEIAPDDLKVREIDYGSGACDNEATVTIGNRTYDITLR